MEVLKLFCITIAIVVGSTEGYGLKVPRIINGQLASKGQFPHQVALLFQLGNGVIDLCGGAIVAPDWILTAAHCLENKRLDSVTIIAGTTLLNQQDSDRVERKASKFVIHEAYLINSNAYDHDLGLVKLQTALQFNDYVRAIDLNAALVRTGSTVTVSGWGYTSDSSSSTVSPQLRYVNLVTIDSDVCKRSFGSVVNDMICTLSGDSTVKATCHGDSGGPLVIKTASGTAHVGVVSFGGAGCESPDPNAFVRTDLHRIWINNVTRA